LPQAEEGEGIAGLVTSQTRRGHEEIHFTDYFGRGSRHSACLRAGTKGMPMKEGMPTKGEGMQGGGMMMDKMKDLQAHTS